MVSKISVGLGAAAAALALAQPGAGLALGTAGAGQSAPDAAEVTALVTALRAAITNLGTGASQQDIEGAIALVIDNAKAPDAVVAAALVQIQAAGGPTAAAAKAVATTRQNGKGGTGALAGGTSDPFSANNAPSVTVGGGTTNYTPGT